MVDHRRPARRDPYPGPWQDLERLLSRRAPTWHGTMIKRGLAFMTSPRTLYEEGCLRLFALPTPEEAALDP